MAEPEVFLVLIYPDSAESEFLWSDHVPRPGERHTSRRGDIWAVAEVLQSGAHTYTVHCEAPTRRHLASDLLARAVGSMVPRELRKRRKYLY